MCARCLAGVFDTVHDSVVDRAGAIKQSTPLQCCVNDFHRCLELQVSRHHRSDGRYLDCRKHDTPGRQQFQIYRLLDTSPWLLSWRSLTFFERRILQLELHFAQLARVAIMCGEYLIGDNFAYDGARIFQSAV